MRRSCFTLFVFTLLALPLAAQQQPNVPLAIQIQSKILGESRNILVLTPNSYRTGTLSYPVLYMTDGERQIEHTAALADFLVREGRMPETILVGIANTDRVRDLTPTHVATADLGGQFALPTSGGADKFLDFIEKELIPHIEKTYRTQPYRVFAGHSFGGLFALHTFFTRPSIFQAVIAVSPTLNWDNRYVYRRAGEWLAANRKTAKTLLFSVGDEGAALDAEFDALATLLKKRAPKNVEWEALRLPDEDHGSVVLPTHYAGLRKAFAPFRFAFNRADDPKTLYARAVAHYQSASRRVGYTLQVPEPTANFIGYRLLQTGSVDEAIETFRKNAQAYPHSANVYDSLAEAYERAGQLDLAGENYERAMKLGRETNDPNTNVYEQNLARVKKARLPG